MAIHERTRKVDGVRFYVIDFRDEKGRRVRETAGTTRKQAKDLLTKRLGEVKSGTYINPKAAEQEAQAAQLAAEAAKGPTFEEFTKTFLRDYRGRGCTRNERRSKYYDYMTPSITSHFKDRFLREITPADIDEFRRSRLGTVTPSTVRKQLIVLGTMFKMARRWGVLTVNPAEDIEKPPEAPHRTRFLSVDEWRSLHSAAEPWLRPILTMAIATGARLKEVVGIQWENVDRDGGMIHLSDDNKTATPRRIPIGTTVKAVLDANGGRFKRAGYVFVGVDGPYATGTQRNRISKRTKAAAVAAKLDGVTFHSIRHTVGSWLGQGTDDRAGFTETEIGWLLGHASTTMTARYVHPHDDRLRAMVAVLDEKLGGDGHPDGHLAVETNNDAANETENAASVSA